jgi:hypothetical protein
MGWRRAGERWGSGGRWGEGMADGVEEGWREMGEWREMMDGGGRERVKEGRG